MKIISHEQMGIELKDLHTLTTVLEKMFNDAREKSEELELSTKEYLLHILSDYGQELLENGEKTLGREFIEFAADSEYYK